MSEGERQEEEEEEEEEGEEGEEKIKRRVDSDDILDPLLEVQLEAQFQHFRSESYSRSIQNQDEEIKGLAVAQASEKSPSSVMAASPSPAALMKLGKSLKSHSVSAPSSPKISTRESKASTLPHSAATSMLASGRKTDATSSSSPRKWHSFVLTNLFKRLSPKLVKRSSSKSGKEQKPWIVVEFSDKDVDGDAASDVGSVASDKSFEMALRHREEQLMQATSSVVEINRADGTRARDESVSRMCTSQPQLKSSTSKKSLLQISKDNKRSKTAKRTRSLSEEKPLMFRLSPRKVFHGLKSSCKSKGFNQSEQKILQRIDDPSSKTDVKINQQEIVAPIVILSSPQEQQPSEADIGHLPLSMTTDSQLKVEQPSILRVHRVHQPPKTLNILNKIVVRSPQVEKVATRMASVESIGSCSLDVDVTASESSGNTDVIDGITSMVSQRTLHSAMGTSGLRTGTKEIESGENEGETRKMAPDDKLVRHLFVPSVNGNVEKEVDEDADAPRRQPSYLNISCSVSGYTSYSCYNSKVREGLRSRDNSPARATFSNISDLVVKNGAGTTTTVVDASGSTKMRTYHSEQRVQLTNGFGSSNGQGASPKRRVMNEGLGGSDDGSVNRNDDVQTKSLVQQRIERLYGPGALAQGFLIRAKARNLYGGVTTTSPTTTSPTTKKNGYTSRRLEIEIPKSSDRKPIGKITAAVIASPSLIPHSATADSWKNESIAQTGASTPPGKGKNGSVGSKSQINGHVDVKLTLEANQPNQLNRQTKDNEATPNADQKSDNCVEKDAHYFLNVMAVEQQKIESLICEGEKKLQDGFVEDEMMAGRFRVTIGKANLLLAQKFEQFRGLCEKNINQLPHEPFPTTVSDLAGFWDMVLIQVQNIYSMFRDIDLLQDEQWLKSQVSEVDSANRSDKITNGVKPKRVSHTKKSASLSPRSPKAEEAARAREEARKRLAEVKRKARSQLTAHKNVEQEIEIFTPETKD